MSGYEKLRVYQRTISFLDYRDQVLSSLRVLVAACDHLQRASESIPLNIAHGSASWNPKERITYYGHACGSAFECAACLDILTAKQCIDTTRQADGKSNLHEIVSMLITMQIETGNRLHESPVDYAVRDNVVFFDHEKLNAYISALAFIVWTTDETPNSTYSGDLSAKLDKASTSVVLNIAEGNGRLSNADKVKFFKTALKSNTQLMALLDIAYRRAKNLEKGRAILTSTAACLTGLIKSKS